jgi:ATP-dependent DNA ligase
MESRAVDDLPEGPGWQFEPKWDGFRCLAIRNGKTVELRAKSGKPLTRYFPEIAAAVQALEPTDFVIDGELVIPVGPSFSFEALQMRLHPAASRVLKLSVETPALYILFDMLVSPGGAPLLDVPLADRRVALERFYASARAERFKLSPYTRKRADAERWLKGTGGALDGVIAKRLDGPYLPGERAMLKIKRLRTADCVVGGFRYGTGSTKVGSLLLGLYDDEGRLDHVGFTSTIAAADRAALTRKLEKLKGGPGFTGNAPGGPSRWSTERSAEWVPLKPKLVAEIRYDHVSDGRFRHGTKFLRWRPDKAPGQCTFDQLEDVRRPQATLSLLK